MPFSRIDKAKVLNFSDSSKFFVNIRPLRLYLREENGILA